MYTLRKLTIKKLIPPTQGVFLLSSRGGEAMHIFTIHSFLSLSWAEWGSILVIGTAVFGGAHKLIGNLIDKVLNPINQNLQKLNKNIEDWNEWHKHANKRFENGDKHFIRHDEQLRDHERRITNLEEQNK